MLGHGCDGTAKLWRLCRLGGYGQADASVRVTLLHRQAGAAPGSPAAVVAAAGATTAAPADSKNDNDDTALQDAQIIMMAFMVFTFGNVYRQLDKYENLADENKDYKRICEHYKKIYTKVFTLFIVNCVVYFIITRVSAHLSIFAVMYIVNAAYIGYMFWKDYTQYHSVEGTPDVNTMRQNMYCVVGFCVILFAVFYFSSSADVWLWLATSFTGVGLLLTSLKPEVSPGMQDSVTGSSEAGNFASLFTW